MVERPAVSLLPMVERPAVSLVDTCIVSIADSHFFARRVDASFFRGGAHRLRRGCPFAGPEGLSRSLAARATAIADRLPAGRADFWAPRAHSMRSRPAEAGASHRLLEPVVEAAVSIGN